MIVTGQDQNVCDNDSSGHSVCHTVEDENCACEWMCVKSRVGETIVKKDMKLMRHWDLCV